MMRYFYGIVFMLAVYAVTLTTSCNAKVKKTNKDFTWRQAAAGGNWSSAGVPFLAFANKLWIIGGGKHVWSSGDGVHWRQSESNAGWNGRIGATGAVFDNKMWIMGGTQDTVDNFRNDVWYSSDGVDWKLATPKAEWSARRWHTMVVFDNKLWILGGMDSWGTDGDDGSHKSDVWSSTDGVHWAKVTENAPWAARFDHRSVVFDNRMWVIGGQSKSKLYNDVWYSSDGVNWTQATSNAGWSKRRGHACVVSGGKIWVFGGMSSGWFSANLKNDVWSSGDGVHWEQVAKNAEWSPRFNSAGVVFNDKIWMLGGKKGYERSPNEIWYMVPAEQRVSK